VADKCRACSFRKPKESRQKRLNITIIIIIAIIMATTIAISEETKSLLKQLGKKGETYDEIVRRAAQAEARRRLFMKFEAAEKMDSKELVGLDEL